MECPLAMLWAEFKIAESGRNPGDCLKEECGQWDKDQKCCSEVSKARAAWALVKVMQEIRNKMPFPNER